VAVASIIDAMGLTIAAIAVGAALGALSRWGLGLALNGLFPAIPPGTLVANLVGGYLVGLALPWLSANPEWHGAWRLFLITGFLGGLTTFSAFSGEVAQLLQQGRLLLASGAIGLHVGGSLCMTLAGFATVAWLRR
jgi:CrcB protein